MRSHLTVLLVFSLGMAFAQGATTPPAVRTVNRPPFYKVFQFPPDKIPRIDGDPSDWAIVPDDYIIGTDQLTNDDNITEAPDPKKFEVKVRVGWVKGLNRLYFLYEAYKDYWDFSQPDLHNDTFELVVDGDRSGEKFIARWRPDLTVPEFDAFFSMQGITAQNYHIFTPALNKDWCMYWGPQQWIKEFPFANHASQYSFKPGEGGKFYLEFYITPYDKADVAGPDHSVESTLKENNLVGLSWAVMDYRGPDPIKHSFWNLSSDATKLAPPTTPGGVSKVPAGHYMYGDASLLMPFKLMPLEPKFVKPFEAKWTFQVLDMSKRLVAFKDESAGQITSWKWDFGDGTTSTEQNPQHTYAAPNNYVVVLDITGPSGTARFSRVWDVTVK